MKRSCLLLLMLAVATPRAWAQPAPEAGDTPAPATKAPDASPAAAAVPTLATSSSEEAKPAPVPAAAATTTVAPVAPVTPVAPVAATTPTTPATPATPATPTASTAVPAHEAGDTPLQEGMVGDDLETNIEVVRRGPFSLRMGGMIQVQGAFYVGDDAAIQFHDPMDTEGFRVRRARFGFGGDLWRHFTYYLAVDIKDTIGAALGGDHGNELLDAKIAWTRFPFFNVSVGVDKVYFSAFSLESSARMELMERPLMVRLSHMVPDRRVGLNFSGEIGGLQYGVGIYNGSSGVTSGNKMGGIAAAVRLQYHILGKPTEFVPDKPRLTIGAAYMFDNTPWARFQRVAGNIDFRVKRVRLLAESIWTQSKAKSQPSASVSDIDGTEAWGLAADLSAFVWREHLQLAVRYEYFSDNTTDASGPIYGKQQLVTAGVNFYVFRNRLKIRVNYMHRDEMDGEDDSNDIAYAGVQAMF